MDNILELMKASNVEICLQELMYLEFLKKYKDDKVDEHICMIFYIAYGQSRSLNIESPLATNLHYSYLLLHYHPFHTLLLCHFSPHLLQPSSPSSSSIMSYHSTNILPLQFSYVYKVSPLSASLIST